MAFKIMLRNTDENKGRCHSHGYTLIEMIVAMAVGLLILGAFVAITLNVNVMMIFTGNYNDLDEYSRNTLDNLSRDVRNATYVNTNSSSTTLILQNTYRNQTITYAWDGSNDLKRTIGTASQVMLTNCNYLTFAYYTRVPGNNLTFPTSVPAQNETKLVSVSWRCSRSVEGKKINTESVQTASVAMRN